MPLSKEDKVKNQYKSSRAPRRCLMHVYVCSRLWDPMQLSSIPPGCWSDGCEGLGCQGRMPRGDHQLSVMGTTVLLASLVLFFLFLSLEEPLIM